MEYVSSCMLHLNGDLLSFDQMETQPIHNLTTLLMQAHQHWQQLCGSQYRNK